MMAGRNRMGEYMGVLSSEYERPVESTWRLFSPEWVEWSGVIPRDYIGEHYGTELAQGRQHCLFMATRYCA